MRMNSHHQSFPQWGDGHSHKVYAPCRVDLSATSGREVCHSDNHTR